MEERNPIWKLFVAEVRLSPDGQMKLPEGGWIELPRPWECDITAGGKLLLPIDQVIRAVTVPENGVVLELIQGGVLQPVVLDGYKQEIVLTNSDSILLPPGLRITLPRDQESLHLSELTRLPAGTTLIWPPAEKKGEDTVVKTRRGPTFVWLPSGGSLTLTVGGIIRATPPPERARVRQSNDVTAES